jgi:predicted MPP superfamily phosphohydrolase
MKINRKNFLKMSSVVLGTLSLNGLTAFKRSEKTVRIGLIADLHYAARGPASGNNRYYNESLNKLDECVTVMNQQKVDFLVELGDFKDQDDQPNEASTLDYLSTIEMAFCRFKGPRYHVLGNHDHDSISKQQFLNGITNTGFSPASGFYSFNHSGFHFVVLDANYTSAGQEYDHGNFDWKDTFIPASQLEWLQNDLKAAAAPTVVFVHQRLDCEQDHPAYCVKNAVDVRRILHGSGNVVLVLQGHYHEGDVRKIDQVVYYTLKAVVEGSGQENNNYAILEIDSRLEMKIIGFRKTKSQKLT